MEGCPWSLHVVLSCVDTSLATSLPPLQGVLLYVIKLITKPLGWRKLCSQKYSYKNLKSNLENVSAHELLIIKNKSDSVSRKALRNIVTVSGIFMNLLIEIKMCGPYAWGPAQFAYVVIPIFSSLHWANWREGVLYLTVFVFCSRMSHEESMNIWKSWEQIVLIRNIFMLLLDCWREQM
jgi:hypothetical protein